MAQMSAMIMISPKMPLTSIPIPVSPSILIPLLAQSPPFTALLGIFDFFAPTYVRENRKCLPAYRPDEGYFFFMVRRLFTFLTPSVDAAICPAFSFCSSVSTAPVRVTVPSKV
jgi:hypothetical protein